MHTLCLIRIRIKIKIRLEILSTYSLPKMDVCGGWEGEGRMTVSACMDLSRF